MGEDRAIQEQVQREAGQGEPPRADDAPAETPLDEPADPNDATHEGRHTPAD
jgi:hypothetical protein